MYKIYSVDEVKELLKTDFANYIETLKVGEAVSVGPKTNVWSAINGLKNRITNPLPKSFKFRTKKITGWDSYLYTHGLKFFGVFPMPTILGYDTETFRIEQSCMTPKIVCCSLAHSTGKDICKTDLVANNDWEFLRQIATHIVTTTDGSIRVAHNAAYDLSIFAANFQELLPEIFKALDQGGNFSDTMIREKLLILARTGDLEYLEHPDGSKEKIKYSLDALVKRRFGVDISADKTADDAYRLNFNVFDGRPLSEWPDGAKKYAIDDSLWAVNIWWSQEMDRQRLITERGIDPFITESFRVKVAFCLQLMSVHGARINPESVNKIEQMLVRELAPEKLSLLISTGILRPATPPRAHKNGKDHYPECTKKGECNCPAKMTKGEDESVDMKVLRGYVSGLAERNKEMTLIFTAPSEKFPEGQLSVNAEFLEEYAHTDKVLEQYKHRQDLQKLVTTELPRMRLKGQPVDVVYPQYDCLKETGRTSSFSSKSEDYASFNTQNVDPRVRECIEPRDGYLLFSIDFSQMELCSLAQKCYDLFGFSVLRDKINAGIDIHAYTGAQLAEATDRDFSATASRSGMTTKDGIAELFFKYKKSPKPAHIDFFNHYRKFAKPVNLGYPGGLGAKTFCKLAKVAYDVIVDEATATQFRTIWKETYPEMPLYFDYINKQCVDRWNKGWDDEKKQERVKYQYTTPFGMHRAGCDYCACANGLGLQSFSADGSLASVCRVVPACWARGGLLGGDDMGYAVRPWGFIHDELVGEVRNDGMAPERMGEMRRIMIESMRLVVPDVRIDANACLMWKWNKDAKPVFDQDNRLTVWSNQ